MKKTILIVGGSCIVLVGILVGAEYSFHSSFVQHAMVAREEAGEHPKQPISENDLRHLPEPVKRYMRFSGIVGMSPISSMRLMHSGTFRPGVDKPFYPIKGEYFLTTRIPSFSWYGKISMFPGVTAAAFDSYSNGHGRMLVKMMSCVTIVDAQSKETALSAFGRCIAEMTMVPSFFLDSTHVRWLKSDSISAECVVDDSGLSTTARLFIRADGALDRIVVERYFDRGDGKATPEKFSGIGSGSRTHNGLRLPAVFDGYWNLKEGDVHYVHFVVDSVQFN
jgi:hypothetical protein